MNLLQEALERLKIKYDDDKLEQFHRYRTLVLEWNEKVNMTAIKDPQEFVSKHYIDSIMICPSKPFQQAKKMIDVGTGAGFPGVPLAILFPEKQFTLMDSLNKRILILREITGEIGLKNVTLVHGRAEDLAHQPDYREQYDLCASRAVARLSVLSEYCLPFVRIGGYFAAYKSRDIEEEIADSKNAIQILGGQLIHTDSDFNGLEIVGGDNHQILYIKKQQKTLSKYPRKAGTPDKTPLK